MKEYVRPSCEIEKLETIDVIMASIQDAGEGTLGTVTGEKGVFSSTFNSIF